MIIAEANPPNIGQSNVKAQVIEHSNIVPESLQFKIQTETPRPTEPGIYVIMDSTVASVPIYPGRNQTHSGAVALLTTAGLPFVETLNIPKIGDEWVEVVIPNGGSGWIDMSTGVEILVVEEKTPESISEDNMQLVAQANTENVVALEGEWNQVELSFTANINELRRNEFLIVELGNVRLLFNSNRADLYQKQGPRLVFISTSDMTFVDDSTEVTFTVSNANNQFAFYANDQIVIFIDQVFQGELRLGIKAWDQDTEIVAINNIRVTGSE